MTPNFSSLLSQLNDQQRKAVLADDSRVLVVAGPGTGKTKTLTVRLAHLITTKLMAPQALLAVTFTTRAARQMRERLHNLVGNIARGIFLGTFHSLCLQVLREEGDRLDLPQDFQIIDRGSQVRIMQQALRQCGQPDTRTFAQRTLQDLSALRNQHANFNIELKFGGLQDIHAAYQWRLRKHGLLDFDDLLLETLRLFEDGSEVRQRLQQRYAHILVDEYQDVNPIQHRLLELLIGQKANLWVVGDVDQAIYAFRGAESAHFLQFEKRFPAGRVIRLEQSYRFSPQIASAASQVIGKNGNRLAFTLKTENPDGIPIQVVSFPDEHAEAAWVVTQIEECVGGTSHYQHYKGKVMDTVTQRERTFRDFAVLTRLHVLSKPLQEAFTKSGIPFRVVGETRFFDKKIIKDLLAYLGVIQNPHDDTSLARIVNCPPRGIGAQTQTALEVQAERHGHSLYDALQTSAMLSVSQIQTIKAFLQLLDQLKEEMNTKRLSQFVASVAEATGLRQWRVEQDVRHDNDLLLFRSIAAKYDDLPTPDALRRLLEETMLAVDADDYDPAVDAVNVMTIHAAKGLEFPVVMLSGVEEGSLPYEGGDLEEERRLFYVGLTRAKEQVCLLHCRNRFLFGERRDRESSRFLSEFEEGFKETTVMPDRVRRSKRSEEPEQLSLL